MQQVYPCCILVYNKLLRVYIYGIGGAVMKCQSCNEKDAIIHFTKIMNGKMEEVHLCKECASKEALFDFKFPFSINDFFAGLIENEEKLKMVQKENTCSICGMTYERLVTEGKFGCASCYETFQSKISSLLRNIHGHDEHMGKIPSKSSKKMKMNKEKEKYKRLLNDAVNKEEYEKAAEYRDIIREIDKKIKDNIDQEEG